MDKAILGIIGGSGIYDCALEGAEWHAFDSPWGPPSDRLRIGYRDGRKIVFLARHGKGHRLAPGEINYRANIDCLKQAGVTDLVSVSACGSLKRDLEPGCFVIVDQFIDRTTMRPSSFFGNGCVGHVSMAEPVSPNVGDAAEASLRALEIPYQRGGTYITIEGPQLSSRAESRLYKSWGADVIGMTNLPEARLAREAEICYGTVAMVTDFDSWSVETTADVATIIATMKQNAANAAALIADIVARFPQTHQPCPVGSDRALEYAILTAPESRDPTLMRKLKTVAGRVL